MKEDQIFFFQVSFPNCKSCIYNCNDPLSHNYSPPAVLIYDFHIFIASSLSFHVFITNQLNDLLPVGLLVQLVARCTGIAEVKGSNPVQA